MLIMLFILKYTFNVNNTFIFMHLTETPSHLTRMQ